MLFRDKSKSTVGGSPRGGSDDKLWDISMSAMEKNTSSRCRRERHTVPITSVFYGWSQVKGHVSHLGSTRFSWFGFQTIQGRLQRQRCLSLDSGLVPYGAGTRPPAAWVCSFCLWPIPANLGPQNKRRFTHTESASKAVQPKSSHLHQRRLRTSPTEDVLVEATAESTVCQCGRQRPAETKPSILPSRHNVT